MTQFGQEQSFFDSGEVEEKKLDVEGIGEAEVKRGIKDELGKGLKNKLGIKVVLGGLFGLLILLGIGVSIAEKLMPEKSGEIEQEVGFIPIEIEKKPGQMVWFFYEDKNVNAKFDYEEEVFVDVSVSIRKPGEVQVLRTVPGGTNGIVRIEDLGEGEYEVRFNNYEQEVKTINEEISFTKLYQLIEAGETRHEFLPTEWVKVVLDDQGYVAKMGVREYNPERLIGVMTGEFLKFYDPSRARVLGESNLGEARRKYLIREDKVHYIDLEDRAVKEFDLESRVGVSIIEPVYSVDLEEYSLSPNNKMVVYKQNEEIHYLSSEEDCKEGSILFEGERLDIRSENKNLKVDFWDDNKFMFMGKGRLTPWRLYVARCGEEKKMTAEKLDLDVIPSSFGWLTDSAIFYSDNNGSYFYNLEDKTKVKYTALGSGVKAVISKDRKHIVAKVGDEYILVDYPAVMSSGVEKHYVITAKELAGEGIAKEFGEMGKIYGNEILINQSRLCQADGDCGEMVRFTLKGDGVFEVSERIELKDIQVDEIVGEVRF